MKKASIFLVLIFISCKATKLSYNLEKKFVPPNGFELDKNIFVDKSEVSNIDWKEYLYWLARVFGKESSEYIEAYPDTTVWLGESNLDSLLLKNYYSNFEFDNFPVVGITQEQAIKYSKWRSDRVFEMLLINRDKIEPRPDQNSTNYFTAKRYFSGNYFDYKPDTTIHLLPKYSLPSLHEIELLNDKVIVSIDDFFDNCKNKICKECIGINSRINSLENHSINYDLYNSPTKPSHIDCFNKSFLEVHNLVGNVSEWTMGYLEIYGGSWKDKITDNKLETVKVDQAKSCYIGFRNICRIDTFKQHPQ
jgi:hypothetical protein